ncbi:RNA polymerase subunit sigma-24 [Geodermatophilus sp. TF02-6]|uniref:RNA polymerase sigma factor SigJ n=1 Tax=Geodermatophilus sp. TF02-6 TaxID=2250575 RepID=UPI000DE87786|nr:RNA polymerase sigma factor SigJ [Geodermatophilus sp. TF02-6]RBY77260.1 RNA polymerase subunit sigma-24 [Geodermatophilus sp. TF02-6]
MDPSADQEPTQTFERYRSLLTGLAYRILGSVADAEDVVQETWLRWSAVDSADVRDPRALLTTIASRLALNALRSRRDRRESYVGPWLPEPVPTADDGSSVADPVEPVLLAESVSLAFLVVLESLSPLERVAFVLHDLFGFGHDEVALVLGRSEPAVRQLTSRARHHVQQRRPHAVSDPEEHARVTAAFMRAAVDGQVSALLELLAPDVVLLTDAGGTQKAALRPIHGADKAARFLTAISSDVTGVRWTLAPLNGRTGVVVHLADGLLGTVDLDVSAGRVNTVRVQLNAAKLTAVRRAADTGGP